MFRIDDPEIPEVQEFLSVRAEEDRWLLGIAVPDLSGLVTDQDFLQAMAHQPKACCYRDEEIFKSAEVTASRYDLIRQLHEAPGAQRIFVALPVSLSGKRGHAVATTLQGVDPPVLSLEEAAGIINNLDDQSELAIELRDALNLAVARAQRRVGNSNDFNRKQLEPTGVRAIVRELTLLANRSIAEALDTRRVPALFRSHVGYVPTMQYHKGVRLGGYLPITAPTTDGGRIVNQAIVRAILIDNEANPYQPPVIEAWCDLFNLRSLTAKAEAKRQAQLAREATAQRKAEARRAHVLEQPESFRDRILSALNQPTGLPRIRDVLRLIFPKKGKAKDDDLDLIAKIFNRAIENNDWTHDLIHGCINHGRSLAAARVRSLTLDHLGHWVCVAAIETNHGAVYTSRPAIGKTKKQARNIGKLDALMQALKFKEVPTDAELADDQAILHWISVRRKRDMTPTADWNERFLALVTIYGGEITENQTKTNGTADWPIYYVTLGLELDGQQYLEDCMDTDSKVAERTVRKRMVHRLKSQYPVSWFETGGPYFGGRKVFYDQMPTQA